MIFECFTLKIGVLCTFLDMRLRRVKRKSIDDAHFQKHYKKKKLSASTMESKES